MLFFLKINLIISENGVELDFRQRKREKKIMYDVKI